MANGYKTPASGAAADFDNAVAALKAMESEDAEFYAGQLEIARRIFAPA